MPNSKIPTITTVEEFLQWTKGLQGRDILYRGLADAAWKVEASAYRRLQKTQRKEADGGVATPKTVLVSATRRLLNRAVMLGFDHRDNRAFSDLQLLAQLQHNGAATCLIDFTEAPLVALWFACADERGSHGKVVAMPTGRLEQFAKVSRKDLAVGKEIEEFFDAGEPWRVWRPEHLGNRIIAQHSCFVFGTGEISKEHHRPVIIDRQSKAKIRRELAALDISEERLFSDFAGFCEVNAHGRADPDTTAEEYMHWGIAFHGEANLPRAIDNYDRAIALDPKNAEAYFNRALAKGDSGDMRGAIADFAQAIAIEPQYAAAFVNRGNVKSQLGDPQGAIADYDRAIAIDSQHAMAINNRGSAKSELGDLKDAVADYDRAIEIDPQFSMAYYNRGNTKDALGDLQGAIADYDQAIAIDSQYAAAYHNRGLAKRAAGNEAGAAEDFATARRLDSGVADRE